MKKLRLLLFIILLAAFSGCQKDGSSLLDKAQVNDIYEPMVFSNPQYAVWYLNAIYKEMNYGYWRWGSAGFLGNATDEGHWKATWDMAYAYTTGNFNSTKNILSTDPWKQNYASIRAANRFISKVDSIPDSENPLINAQIRQRMKGEAIFLKAFFYADLLKYFGGVPIVNTVLDQNDDEILFEPRETYDATVKFIS